MGELQASFADELDRLRRAARVSSHTRLAKECGLPRSTVNEILSGNFVRAPQWDKVLAIVTTCVRLAGDNPQVKELGDINHWRIRHGRLEADLRVTRPARSRSSKTANQPVAAASFPQPGRAIHEVSPDDLEVHRATADRGPSPDALPTYLLRAHDRALDDLLVAALGAAQSGVAVLVSDSTSGKTRALYEALHRPVTINATEHPGDNDAGTGTGTRSLAEAGWRVWPHITPIPARRLLDELATVPSNTVIWLNEAQRYLIEPDQDTAAAIAAQLRELLDDSDRAPVLILGTLWPQYWNQVLQRPGASVADRFADARTLLNGKIINVPNTFSGADLDAARASTDSTIREALRIADVRSGTYEGASNVLLTQFIAGVPALLDLLGNATTPAKAVLNAAMDARRLGHNEWIPTAFLQHAAPAYLTDDEQREHLTDPKWFTTALATLTAPHVSAAVRALNRRPVIAGSPVDDVVRLEDYLDERGRRTRISEIPSQGFWDAALEHAATPHDLYQLGYSASRRLRLRIADSLLECAADAGDANSRALRAELREMSGRRDEAEELARRAANDGDPRPWVRLAELRTEWTQLDEAENAWLNAAHAGDSDAWCQLARRWEKAGRHDDAERAWTNAANAGNPEGWNELSQRLEEAGRHDEADEAARSAANAGYRPTWSYDFACRREEAGQLDEAERAWRDAAAAGDGQAWVQLTQLLERVGRHSEADTTARRAAHDSYPWAWIALAELREQSGRHDQADETARSAADAGHPELWERLARLRGDAGQHDEAERAWLNAANAGHREAWGWLAWQREEAGRHTEAEEAAGRAANAGDSFGWLGIAIRREEAGRPDEADEAARCAANAGDPEVWYRLADMRMWARQDDEVERALINAAEAGHRDAWGRLASRWDKAGRHLEAEEAAQRAADAGNPHVWRELATSREEDGRHEQAEEAARSAVAAGDADIWFPLAVVRDRMGRYTAADEAARRATDSGGVAIWINLANLREKDGRHHQADEAARHAAEAGHVEILRQLALRRERASLHAEADNAARHAADIGEAGVWSQLAMLRQHDRRYDEALQAARHAADAGDTDIWDHLVLPNPLLALAPSDKAAEESRLAADADADFARFRLTALREQAARYHDAVQAAIRAADADNPGAYTRLAILLERGGRHREADKAALHAADTGNPHVWHLLAAARNKTKHDQAHQIVRYGLEIDRTVTSPW